MDSAGQAIVPGNCIKCKTRPFSINVRYAVYCDECFLDQAFHKYRLATAKSKSSTAPERILLAYSGGYSSHLLLHFSQLFRLKDPRRLNLDQVQIVHIVIPGAPDCQVLIDAALRPYDLTCRHLTLASVIYEDSASATEAQMRLTRLLEACTVPTSRADLLRILTRLALVRCAATEKCSKLYVGDNCSRIAVDIMAATCTGRGEALPWMLSPRQVYLAEDVQVVRPLRDLVKLEIDYHIDLVRAQYPPPPYSIIDKVDDKEKPESIYDLTDRFIGELDAENSATVSTVARTAAKLQTASSALERWRPCSLCACPLDATTVGAFCYGCHDILNDMNEQFDSSLLPLPHTPSTI